MSRLPAGAFRRYDEMPDEEFYKTPRLVAHIDDRAIAAVTQLYREFFPVNGEILDLMSSWVSHLPEEVRYRRVVGLGMNEVELKKNPRLDVYVVQNLNRTPEQITTWTLTSPAFRGWTELTLPRREVLAPTGVLALSTAGCTVIDPPLPSVHASLL